MNAAVLESGFTSSDWFQLLYTPLWMAIGWAIGVAAGRIRGRMRRRELAHARPPRVPFSVVVATPVTTHLPRQPTARRRSRTAGQSSDDDWAPLALFAAALGALALAWLYLHGRELALGLAAAPVALTLGLFAETIRGSLRGGGWWLLTGMSLALSVSAVGCGFVLLHPPAAPDAYDALFEGFRREGISLGDLFDGTVMFIAYQAIGALMLILASYLLLYLVSSVVVKEALLRGATATWWRRSLSAGARSRKALVAGLGTVLLLLVMSFAFGSGYAYSLVGGDEEGAPRVVAPSAALRANTLTVDFVLDRAGDVRLTVQRRAGSKPILRRRSSLQPGRHRLVRRVSSRGSDRLVVTLTPLQATGGAGTARRIVVRRER